jgi:hypothetical protein
MKAFVSRATFVVAAISLMPLAQAAPPLFLGPGFFSVPPNTQMGTITSNFLTVNYTPFGFMVAGQFHVSVPAGLSTGTLLNYQVKRPLNPTYGSLFTNLQTWVIGFSQPPAGGTYSPTTGFVNSYLEISGQAAQVPLSLTNGAATWNINMAGPSFNYVSGTDMWLVSDFQLDASRLSGPAGTWIVDLPIFSTIVPEPGMSVMICTAGLAMLLRRR